MGLQRGSSKKFEPEVIKLLVDQALEFVLSKTSPELVLLFGSAAVGKFDAQSDIDLLIVFSDLTAATKGRKALYSGKPLKEHSVDFICMARDEFERKKDLGGIAYVAHADGTVLYSSKNKS